MALGTIFRPDLEPSGEPCQRSRAEAVADFEAICVRHDPILTLVEVSGDRWSGKTTVLQDFAEVATRTGWAVAAGSATSAEAGTAFGAFGEALNELIGSVVAQLAPICPPGYARWLAGIFPALEASPQPAEACDLYKALNAIGKLIEMLCTLGDLVLLLDDMHWADQNALNLLAHLLRYPPNGTLVVVIAHRPRQSSHHLRGVISAAAASGVADRVVLAPVALTDALALLPGDLSSSACAAILTEGGGNPGLLKALASMRIVPGRSACAPPALPPGVLAACLRDFHAVSARGLLVAQSAAVLDEPFEPDMLKAVAQLGDAQARAAIDELVGEDVICSDRCFPRLRFANPLLRAAAYQSAGYGWLAGARAKAAELLASRDKPTGQIARQVVRAGAVGDEGSARFLLQAAQENLWLDPAQAALWVRTAADLQAGSTASGPASQLLLGKALTLAGRLAEALHVLEGVTELVPGDHLVWAEAVSWRIWSGFLLGRGDKSSDDLTTALAALPQGELAAVAELRQRRLTLALEAGAQPSGEDELALSGRLADSSGMPAAELSALLAAAACHHRPPSARRYAAVSAESFGKAADDHVARHLEGLYWLGRAHDALGDAEAALACCERGLGIAEQRQMGGMAPRFAASLATVQLGAGDLDGATRHAACARTAAELTGSDYLVRLAAEVDAKIRRARDMEAGTPTGARVVSLHSWSAASRALTAPARTAIDDERDRARSELDSLSGRELQVALLVSDGRTNEQIARRLGLSSKTVETYLARIFKKLVVSCRAEVATMVGRSTH